MLTQDSRAVVTVVAVVVVAAAVVVVAGVVALPMCLACPGGTKDAFGQSLLVVVVLAETSRRKGLRLRPASM